MKCCPPMCAEILSSGFAISDVAICVCRVWENRNVHAWPTIVTYQRPGLRRALDERDDHCLLRSQQVFHGPVFFSQGQMGKQPRFGKLCLLVSDHRDYENGNEVGSYGQRNLAMKLRIVLVRVPPSRGGGGEGAERPPKSSIDHITTAASVHSWRLATNPGRLYAPCLSASSQLLVFVCIKPQAICGTKKNASGFFVGHLPRKLHPKTVWDWPTKSPHGFFGGVPKHVRPDTHAAHKKHSCEGAQGYGAYSLPGLVVIRQLQTEVAVVMWICSISWGAFRSITPHSEQGHPPDANFRYVGICHSVRSGLMCPSRCWSSESKGIFSVVISDRTRNSKKFEQNLCNFKKKGNS